MENKIKLSLNLNTSTLLINFSKLLVAEVQQTRNLSTGRKTWTIPVEFELFPSFVIFQSTIYLFGVFLFCFIFSLLYLIFVNVFLVSSGTYIENPYFAIHTKIGLYSWHISHWPNYVQLLHRTTRHGQSQGPRSRISRRRDARWCCQVSTRAEHRLPPGGNTVRLASPLLRDTAPRVPTPPIDHASSCFPWTTPQHWYTVQVRFLTLFILFV